MESHGPLETVRDLCRLLQRHGGRGLLVGGWVRDRLLGRPSLDLDLEVYGIDPAALQALLEERHGVDLTGRAFGIIKLKGLPIDVSVPRRESKAGQGHKGFLVASDPHMTPAEAARRRDFTVNAMAFDPLTDELIDPYGGEDDLRRRLLRHTSEHFGEDPLRVLRGMQFCARFRLDAHPDTVALCRTIGREGLAPERIFEEWRKLLLQGEEPSRGLRFLRDTGWVRHFPELEALIGCEQDRSWHPEGDVWIHTLHCLDAFAAARTGDDWEDLVVGLAVLCHDLGKPLTTTRAADGRIRALGHCEAGIEPTRTFLERMTRHAELERQVVPLVAEHLRPLELYDAGASDAAVRRLALRVGRIDRLVRVALADQQGRPPLVVEEFAAGDWLLQKAAEQKVTHGAPPALLQGRHLMARGLRPGPQFGAILDACYEAQLDGAFADLEGAEAFLDAYLAQEHEGSD